MKEQEITEHVITDPELTSAEKEMSIGFSKKDDKATIFTAIASQIRRLLTHTDVDVTELSIYKETDETRWQTTVKEFDGDGKVVGLKGKVPIESLKIQANPRGNTSYAHMISPQTEVSFDDDG
jgi:hypothetical protein